MCSPFDDAPPVHDQDHIRREDRMSRCAIASVVRLRISRSSAYTINSTDLVSSALVASSKSKILRILENDASDCHALLFTARQLEAAFADNRLVSLGEFHNTVVYCRRTRGRFDLVLSCIQSTIGYVFANSRVEQVRFLGDEPDRAAQTRQRDVSNVDAVDRH